MTNTERIQFLDLKSQYQSIKKEVLAKIEEVCDNTAFSGGRYVEEFESGYATFCNVSNVIAVNNGTNALHLALMALKIGPGDEVIIPANTFIATAWAVTYTGATPVFVDCEPTTWQIDPEAVKQKINAKTKAIIGVHLYGQPCDIDALQAIAEEHGIYFIEDAAQAHGATYRGKKVGGFGRLSCFSFYPGKNLGAFGEGGAVTTNDSDLAEKMKFLRNHGAVKKYYHEMIGYNMRMGGLEAATLSVKLKYIDRWNNRRKEIANKYRQGLINTEFVLQHQPSEVDSVYHLMVLTVSDRAGLIKHLNENNIFPGLHYPVPCHLQKAYISLNYKKGDMPNTEYLSEHCVSLPMYAELSDEKVDRVIDALCSFGDA